jgi:hypothetical protein
MKSFNGPSALVMLLSLSVALSACKTMDSLRLTLTRDEAASVSAQEAREVGVSPKVCTLFEPYDGQAGDTEETKDWIAGYNSGRESYCNAGLR